MSSLSHHGIKGQRWGVRRFQNKDGTRTAAGKKHYSVEAVDADFTRSDIKKLVNGFSRKDKQMFFDRHYPNEKYDKGNEVVAKRFVVKEGKDIVAFIDANERWTSDNLNVVIGTSKSARGKGYASVLSKKMVDWYEEEGHKKHGMLEWNAYEENVGSRKAAEKAGFKQINSGYDQTAHYVYSKTSKKELNNLSTAYRNKSSVEKEVSDKINSDFQKTKFGKFSPKTTISAYGSAYTPYDSELGFYKSMIVDRHASKWAKKHHSEDIARYDKATSDWSSAYETFNKKRRRIKHTSMGGTMYIEGNALILGDSSYLEHHGIRGQRWGVRRFQNRDGSLTNAGRKRLGYATKSALKTVGKAFKAGAKAGGNAVKAAKAHHEEAEAKKKEKKKEKAAKSRLGVLANKDLFTDDELRALNQRFKVEDELKMASIQKGVEIAKAVGTIASNAATAAKAYEDITGQSLSPIKRQAAELKKQQDAEDRARKIAREDAEEARKVAQEERNVKTYEQELRKATASADKEEFLAKKTKAQADQEILKALKGARDFDKPDDDDDDPPKPPNGGGGSDGDGKSWMEKATSGGGNVFERMKYENDPEYRADKDAHDKKVEWEQHEKERDAKVFGKGNDQESSTDQALRDMINKSNARTGRGKANDTPESKPTREEPEPKKQRQEPTNDPDEIPFTSKNLRLEKDRYAKRDAFKKAKEIRNDEKEKKIKEQDDKAVDQTINDVIEAQRRNTELVRQNDPHGYDRAVAKDYVKGKAKEAIDKIPETLGNLNPINRMSRKIANKVEQEGYENTRKALKQQYEDMAKSQGRDEANYVMYNTRVAGLQGQGYSEKQAKEIANNNPAFSAKRNRRLEYAQRSTELEEARKKTSRKLDDAEKKLVDDYYKKIYLDVYAPGTAKRKALDKEYDSAKSKIDSLRSENQDLYDKGMKEAKKILEHSFSIQNGVIFIDESVSLSHHGIRGQKWGVRRFQNPDGTLTDAGKRREAMRMARELNQLDSRQATASRNYSNLSMHKGYYDRKVGKLEYKKSISDEKGNLKKSEKLQKKIDKGKANVERISRMMKFASDDYDVSEKKIKTILSKINESTDYAWKTTAIEREFTSYNGGFYKDMKKNAGKSKLFEGNYYESAYGNHYTVKHDKNGKRKKKWEASKQQRQTHNPVHTVHYYY